MIVWGAMIVLAGCQAVAVPTPGAAPVPTVAVVAAVPTAVPTATAVLPPTWTPAAAVVEQAAMTGPTLTPRPSATPWPTFTPTLTDTPTSTSTPTDTPTPTPTATATVDTSNLLRNGSFEGGWYHLHGDPELQIPEFWRFEFDEGRNSLDPDPWNAWVRPEVRVLPKDFLPAAEHETFIWDGEQTLKIFKGSGSISVKLLTDVYLEPGQYALEINIFPDLVESYTEQGGKVWASDKLSGEVNFIVDGRYDQWQLPAFGRKNTLTYIFTVNDAHLVEVGVALRGRWAIANNGWFLDDWRLFKLN